MAIDISSETLLSLTDASKLKTLPTRRKGRRPHMATIWRWCVQGVRGIRLESIVVGGTRCTTEAALQRFFERLTAQADGAQLPARSAAEQRRSVRDAERLLDAAGI